MLDRRTCPRERVIFGGTIASSPGRADVDCVVRNISRSGINVELPSLATVPDHLRIVIPKMKKAFQAKIVWWRGNRAGLAFEPAHGDKPEPQSLEERLRISERKARALKQRVRELLRERSGSDF